MGELKAPNGKSAQNLSSREENRVSWGKGPHHSSGPYHGLAVVATGL